MRTKLTVLVTTIILSTNVNWGQQLNNQVTARETVQSPIGKSHNDIRATNRLEYTILIKNGESIKDDNEYITSSLFIYTYSAQFSQVPSFLKLQIDNVSREKFSGSFVYNYYTDLTLTADSNATPGRYKPIIVFNFYYTGTLEEIDTLELDVTIYNRHPDKPQLVSPGNNQLNQQRNIILRWNKEATAKSCVVQLSADQFFASVLKTDTTASDTTEIIGLTAEQKYYWRVQARNSSGASDWSDTWNFTVAGLSSLEKVGDVLPKEYSLAQNFPNPFNPTTAIEFSLPKSGYVSLTIFNSIGQVVRTIVDRQMAAGRYRAQWDAVNAASGVYFYHLKAGEYAETKKMILLR